MQITSNFNNYIPQSSFKSAPVQPQSLTQDKFTFVEPPPEGYNPNTPVPGGKYIVGAAAGLAAGAIGAYAGFAAGAGPAVAGLVAGAITGTVGLGAVGMFADLSGGLMSNTNYSKPAAITGAVLGGAGGALIGAYAANPLAGIALGAGAAIATGLAVTAWADEQR
jgi:hypothetical protein